MSDSPVQVVVAAFNSPDGAGEYMEALRLGKKEGLIGIADAAVVVKNAEGKIKIIDAKERRGKGFITGAVVGGLVGLIVAPPVAVVAAGGGLIGTLVGQLRSTPIRDEMKEIGSALTPNSSAIVAVIEHTWVTKLETALAEAGAQVIRDSIQADIAAQLNAGRNVIYTAGAGSDVGGVARVVTGEGTTHVDAILADQDGIYIDTAVISTEPVEETVESAAQTNSPT
jgi:uncharacterized membrane protein